MTGPDVPGLTGGGASQATGRWDYLTGCGKTLYEGHGFSGVPMSEDRRGLYSVRENLKRPEFSPRVWWEPPASVGGAGLQSRGDALYVSTMGFSPGFEAGAKAHDRDRTLSRNAEALLPSAKAEGSHQTPGDRVLTHTLQPVHK